jgi:hypothetical protein
MKDFQQSTAKFEQPREISLIQALLGLGRGDRPCAAPDVQISLVQRTRKVRAQPQLESSRSSSDGCEHSRRLGMFQDVDLRCQLDE